MWPLLFYFWASIACGLLLWQFARYVLLTQQLKRKAAPNGALEPVSVVIAAHNAAANLDQNLPLILEQRYPNFEVWVINNGSTDASVAVLKKWQENYPQNLKVLHLAKANKKAALQAGIQKAAHNNLVFTDADCQPASEQWLNEMAQGLATYDLVLGYGPLTGSGFTSALSQWETWQTAGLYYRAALKDEPYMGVGRNMAYRKSLFNKVGGYASHENLRSGDDDLLVQAAKKAKANIGLIWAQECFMFSHAPKNLGQWWRQKRRHFATANHYAPADKWKLAAEGSAQLLLYLLLPFALLVNAPLTVFIFLTRYFLSLAIALPLARHFKVQKVIWLFPVYEVTWAILATALQIKNTLAGKPKNW
jgi:glycosyltransferase involved in cell wall biosynthesis